MDVLGSLVFARFARSITISAATKQMITTTATIGVITLEVTVDVEPPLGDSLVKFVVPGSNAVVDNNVEDIVVVVVVVVVQSRTHKLLLFLREIPREDQIEVEDQIPFLLCVL
eukprot:m.167481 g.167481  ORF g.167481 m.167481 type:complete len:113 (+) comp13464_c2_seq4:1912-2250(+)